ncbi:MAG TPA: 30S ribosomal protein S12 methylthiotransferase RimO [Humisphaera sp.]|jgi:ribosomal protein S12 methylthiotransferase|nr:30S ribosomal protein S12 methylthiotransferase RimO [Humisphaera sp.]
MARSAAKIRSVAFVSLGCPKNLVDSERMLGLLAQDGLTVTADHSAADAIVVNTCGFLEASREESLQAIREAIDQKTNGRCKRVIVAGCLVQRHKTKLLADVPQVDRLVGVFDREHIVEAVHGKENPRQEHGHFLGKYHDLSRELREGLEKGSGFGVQGSVEGSGFRVQGSVKNAKDIESSKSAIQHSAFSNQHSPLNPERRTLNPLPVFEDDRARLRLTPRHYAYLRISEGCNQGCTFCTIPSIRGPMRSKPIEQILAEARELAADGAVELNLIGQDTTSYGTDIGYAAGLSGLLSTLNKELKDVHWLRLMYAYPSCFSDEMIKTIADSAKVVKYIDMPLQHINDQILTMMRRRVTRKQIETLLEKLRKWVPGIAIRTTFIAGPPTETDQQHKELVKFVADFGFDMMGVFPYSRESGTPMGRMEDQIPDDVKKARVEELMLTQQKVAFAKSKSMKGQSIEVLIDRPAGRDAEDGYVARSQSQAPDIDSVTFVHGEDLHPGQLVNVRITDYQAYDLVAEIPKKKSRSLKVVTR